MSTMRPQGGAPTRGRVHVLRGGGADKMIRRTFLSLAALALAPFGKRRSHGEPLTIGSKRGPRWETREYISVSGKVIVYRIAETGAAEWCSCDIELPPVPQGCKRTHVHREYNYVTRLHKIEITDLEL
jgi:hypothetical protein